MLDVLANSLFFGAVLTCFSFQVAVYLNHKYPSPLTNIFIISMSMIAAVLALANVTYEQYYESAKYISYFSTPATVALAVPLYRRVEVLKKNAFAILSGVTAGILANTVVIIILCKIFDFSNIQFVSLLPKSVTTPIALGLCTEYGGITAITVMGTAMSGVVGNAMGVGLIKLFRIKHPLSRGLVLGSSAHGLGTVKAMELGEVEGATASLAIAVTGVLTVIIAPFFINFI